MLYLCVRMTKQNLIVREISGITRVSEINRCDCCHWKRYFFGGILVVILTVFQQGADQEPISFAGQYPGIETEFIADYTLYGEDDENPVRATGKIYYTLLLKNIIFQLAFLLREKGK